MAKRNVYVSSTFEDLRRHRDAVREALLTAGYDVTCMENYAASDERPLDLCLGDVARCDLYVLIIAHRYGFVPQADNPDGKSITQLEYEEAVRKDRRRLVFFVDGRHRWPERFKQGGAAGRKLKAFRAQALLDRVARPFRSPDSLAKEVLAALQSRINRDPDAVAPPGWRWPEAFDFSAYMAEKRAGFAGRDWLFAQLDSWLAESGQQALVIRADFGVGKSALAAELVKRRAGTQVVAHHFCQHDTVDTLHPASFVRSLMAQLRARVPGYRDAVEADSAIAERFARVLDDPAGVFEAAVLNPLQRVAAPDGPRLIVVDALDEALELDAATRGRCGTIVSLLEKKAKRLPPWLRMLATSRNNDEVLRPLRQGFVIREIDAESADNRRDLDAFIRGRCARPALRAQIAAAGLDTPAFAAALLAKCGGKILYALRVLDDVERGGLAAADVGALPPGMDGFYLDAFDRRFARRGIDYAPVRELLGILAIAQEPLPPATLGAIAGIDETEVVRRLRPLPDFLRRREGSIGFDHFSIAEWLTAIDPETRAPRADSYSVDIGAAKRRMGDWIGLRLAAAAAHGEPYLVRHLLAHLEDDGARRSALSRLLFDFHWLDARLRARGVATLIGDAAMLDDDAGQVMVTALRNSAHVVERMAEQLAPQLLGRLRGAAGPDLARLCTQIPAMPPSGQARLLPLTASLKLRRSQLLVLEGHGGGVTALAVMPGGRLASGGWDRTVVVWDASGRVAPLVLEGHEDTVRSIVVLPDGRIASGSDDKTVRVWDPRGGAAPVVLQGHGGRVTTLAVLPDGRIASGSADHTVRVWDPDGRRAPIVLEGHRGIVEALAVLPDGRIASGSDDTTVRLWDPGGRAAPLVFAGHAGAVATVAVLPDGRIASGSDDRTVRVWDPGGRAAPILLEGHSSAITILAALPDGRIASAGFDGSVRLWDPSGRSASLTFAGAGDRITTLAVLPDRRIAWGSDDRTVRVWDPSDRLAPVMLDGHDGAVAAVAALPDGRIASAGNDKTVRVWDPSGRDPSVRGEGHLNRVTTLAVLPGGRVASGSFDRTVRVWDPSGRAAPVALDGHAGLILALAVLPDGRIASGSVDATIRVWDPSGCFAPVVLVGHRDWLASLAVLSDGRIASGSVDATIRVWDPSGRLAPVVLEGHRGRVGCVALLPDGRLASGSDDETVRIWDPSGCIAPLVLQGHGGRVASLVVLPDGRLASRSYDELVRVWDPRGRIAAVVLEGHGREVTCLAVLPDGRIASGSDDETVRVWDPDARVAPLVIDGHDDSVTTLAVLSDGRIASASRDGAVRVWEASGAPVALFVADASITCLAAVTDRLIAAGDSAGAVHFLELR